MGDPRSFAADFYSYEVLGQVFVPAADAAIALGYAEAAEVARIGPITGVPRQGGFTDFNQYLIDDIVENELRNVRLTYHPEYDPSLPSDTYGVATRGKSTRIGSLAVDQGRRETLITIVHEEMHHRLWVRGWRQSEAYVESVAQRFASMKLR